MSLPRVVSRILNSFKCVLTLKLLDMGLLDGFDNSLQIIRATISLERKHPVLLESLKWGLALWGLMVVLLLAGVASIFVLHSVILTLLAFLLFVILVLMYAFSFNFLMAAQSYVVYGVVKDGDAKFSDGVTAAKRHLGGLVVLAAVQLLIQGAANSARRRSNVMSLIFSILFSSLAWLLESGFDLFRDFVIPAMVIPDKSLWDAFSDVKELASRISESLVGILGFNFVSRVLHLALLIVCVIPGAIGIWTLFQGAAFRAIGIAVFAVAVILFIIGSIVISLLFSFAKSTYFTLLWLEVNQPKLLSQNKELSDYLAQTKQIVENNSPVQSMQSPGFV